MLASTPSTYLGGVTAIRIHVNTVRTWRESRGDVLCHVLAAGFSALVGAIDNRDAGCTMALVACRAAAFQVSFSACLIFTPPCWPVLPVTDTFRVLSRRRLAGTNV